MTISGADNLMRANIVWNLESGQEIAVTSLHLSVQHFTGNDLTWPDATQQVADVLSDKLTSHWSDLGTMISNKVNVSRIDTYRLDDTGHALDKGTHGYANTDVVGAATGAMLPPSSAVVLQLWGYTPGGFVQHPRRHRGRLFLPGAVISVLDPNTGLISTTNQDSLAGWWGAFFNDLQGAHVGTPVPPGNSSDFIKTGIYSKRDNDFVQLQAVTVAHLPAVQRRRINALASTHSAATTINS